MASRNAQPALMLWLVHITDKLIELSFEFSRWGNGANSLNNGLQLLYLRHDQVSRKFLAAKAKLRSCVIHVAKVRSNLLSYELPKRFGPYFVQLIKSHPLKSPTPRKIVSGLFEQFILKPNFWQSFKSLC